MYSYFDDNNIEILSGYPEREAVYNSVKLEVTFFYLGNIEGAVSHIHSLEEAEIEYQTFIRELGEAGERKHRMNLLELKKQVDNAIELAHEFGANPIDITVTIQIDREDGSSLWSDKDTVELHYDNNGCASGCVITGYVSI